MTAQRILLDVPEAQNTVDDLLRLVATDPRKSTTNIASWIQRLAAVGQANIRVMNGGVQASQTVTFASFIANDTVTLNGVVLTGKASASLNTEFAVGASNQACANNFADCVNNSTQAKIIGTVKAQRRHNLTLSSFVAGDTITINGVTLTGVTAAAGITALNQFVIATSDALTAQNLINVINTNPFLGSVTATRATAVVTLISDQSLTSAASAHVTVANDTVLLTSIIPGTIANLFTLAISARGSVGGATFSGGTDGTHTTLSVGR